MAIKSSNQITFTEQKKIVEIKEWYLATAKDSGVTRDPQEGWTLEVQIIDQEKRYLWNYEEVVYSIGSSDVSDPIVIGFYGNGADGKGISDIKNYYYTTTEPELPENPNWSQTVLMITPTNKYLWNYEEFIYTDGSSKSTDPAIIGVYGDSGTGSITFEIYSTQGFVFKENIEEIELHIAAFDGVDPITGVACTWSRWDDTLNNGAGDYIAIAESTVDQAFIVANSGDGNYDNLRCSMMYNDNQYNDYVNLTHETAIYSAGVNFFNGSNVFDASYPYVVAYVNLYRNNKLIESILTDRFYVGTTSVSNDVITTDMTETAENGDLVYFIYRDGQKYKITLGEYQSGTWRVFTYNHQYKYRNSIFVDNYSNVILISKNDINKSANVIFNIYNQDDDFLTTTNVTVIDTNDPIVSSTMPQNPHNGQLWLDTSTSPYLLKIYEIKDGEDAGEWKLFSQQNGRSVYTSRPDQYSEGDLWILADGETCNNYQSGTMLRATTTSNAFVPEHWVDSDPSSTIKNIKESFSWDGSGIRIAKRVVDDNNNVSTPFYVHLDSTRMGFHSVEYNNSGQVKSDNEVVHIGNNSAIVKNATFVDNNSKPNEYEEKYGDTDGARFDCNSTFNKQVNLSKINASDNKSVVTFTFKIEENNSLSLAIF